MALYLIAQSVIPEHLDAFYMEENVSAHKLRNIPRGNCAQERRILQTFLRRKVLLPFRIYRRKGGRIEQESVGAWPFFRRSRGQSCAGVVQ
jgi:hypothetical protein